MSDQNELPSLGDLISGWLGFRLPGIPFPQTRKNIDKAASKLIFATSENLEARIKGSTRKTKARNKLAVEELFRTQEEKRKFENRAAAVGAALSDIEANPPAADAAAEIE